MTLNFSFFNYRVYIHKEEDLHVLNIIKKDGKHSHIKYFSFDVKTKIFKNKTNVL